MFTTTPTPTIIRTSALTIAAAALQLSLPVFEGVISPDFFEALRNAALLSSIPSLLLFRRKIHSRF